MPDFKTVTIDSRELHRVWPWVEKGVNEIIYKTKPEWIANDVYASLRNNAACLMLSFCDNVPIGFTIHYFSFTPFSNQKEMLVWCAWTIKPADRPTGLDVNGAVASTMQVLYDLAKREGCAHITCISPRKGYPQWIARHGFHFYHSTFRRTVL